MAKGKNQRRKQAQQRRSDEELAELERQKEREEWLKPWRKAMAFATVKIQEWSKLEILVRRNWAKGQPEWKIQEILLAHRFEEETSLDRQAKLPQHRVGNQNRERN